MTDSQSVNIHQEKLEAILANAVDAIITIDERGLIETANPASERLFGYALAELVGRNVSMLMPNPYRDAHDQYLRNYIDSGVKKIIGIGREVVGKRKDGSEFPVHLAVSEISLGDRKLFCGIVRDITDLKVAEKQLAELNADLEQRVQERTAELHEAQSNLIKSEKLATLGQVAGGIAHEIRNPLNAVKTSAYYLLNAKQPPAEKVTEHLERIDRQVNMIDNVVTALSDVAKLPDAQLDSVDIERLLRSVVSSTSLPRNVKVEFEFEESLPACLVDENQVPIAFRNLIRNARDAMPAGGRLVVGARLDGEAIAAFVADDGVGIPAERLEKILEPLFTTKARGMGLGLAITRAVLVRNHCELIVESEVGQGSKFTIRIPLSQR